MPVDFLFKRVQNAQPRIRTECRSRNGHRVLNFLAGRGWDRPCIKSGQRYRTALVASREVKFMSWRGQTKIDSTERHTSTKNFCLWKSFRQKFLREQNQNVGRNFCQVLNLQLLQTLCNAAFRERCASAIHLTSRRLHVSICLTSIVDLVLASA